MNLVGPLSLRLLFQAFVVVVGFLILAGAANTAIVGSNGVLNRVSEDGVLTDWFRKPHKRFGTTYRLINLIVILQMVTILLSRGDVFVLGEAYAFGVIWSFAFNAISVLILRFKRPDAPRPWRVPFNPKIGGREMPLGLVGIAFVLFACAVVNLFTKEIATIAGDRVHGRLLHDVRGVGTHRDQRGARPGQSHLDQFQLDTEQEIDPEHIGCRRGSILVPVRDYNTLSQLDWVLDQPDAASRDVVVLTVRVIGQGHGTPGVSEDQVFSDYEQKLFTRVVAVAERHGRPVTLLVTPGTNIFDALAQSAVKLRTGMVVVGESEIMTPEQQAHLWARRGTGRRTIPGCRRSCVVLCKDGRLKRFSLGAHMPDLSTEDIDHIHRLWVEAVATVGPRISHRDVVRAALSALEIELHGDRKPEAVTLLTQQSAARPQPAK